MISMKNIFRTLIKKILVFLIIYFILISKLFAQNITENTCLAVYDTVYKDTVVKLPNKPAEYIGGKQEFIKFIKKHLTIDPRLNQNSIIAILIINKIGKVVHVRTLKPNEGIVSDNIKKILYLSPLWIPAKCNGIYVSQIIILPLHFRLNK